MTIPAVAPFSDVRAVCRHPNLQDNIFSMLDTSLFRYPEQAEDSAPWWAQGHPDKVSLETSQKFGTETSANNAIHQYTSASSEDFFAFGEDTESEVSLNEEFIASSREQPALHRFPLPENWNPKTSAPKLPEHMLPVFPEPQEWSDTSLQAIAADEYQSVYGDNIDLTRREDPEYREARAAYLPHEGGWVLSDGTVNPPASADWNLTTAPYRYGFYPDPALFGFNSLMVGDQGRDMEAEKKFWEERMETRDGGDISRSAVPFEDQIAWLRKQQKISPYHAAKGYIDPDYVMPFEDKDRGEAEIGWDQRWNEETGMWQAHRETWTSHAAREITLQVCEFLRNERDAMEQQREHGTSPKVSLRGFILILLEGYTGGGKSVFASSLAATLGIPLVISTASDWEDPSKGFFGANNPEAGSALYEISDIGYAYVSGGVVLIDEIYGYTPDAQLALSQICDPNNQYYDLETNDRRYSGKNRLYRHPAFRVVATGNPQWAVQYGLGSDEVRADAFGERVLRVPFNHARFDNYDSTCSTEAVKRALEKEEETGVPAMLPSPACRAPGALDVLTAFDLLRKAADPARQNRSPDSDHFEELQEQILSRPMTYRNFDNYLSAPTLEHAFDRLPVDLRPGEPSSAKFEAFTELLRTTSGGTLADARMLHQTMYKLHTGRA